MEFNGNEFKRKIENELLLWKESLVYKKRALLLRGLRQVGKSTVIRKFARLNFSYVVYIDFIKNPDYKIIFNTNSDVDRIIEELSFKDKKFKFVPFKTVIIFDEIQECASARRCIKSFMEDGRFDLMCTGSLLGIKGYNMNYQDVSVGYEYPVKMYSMDFEEFLWAYGYEETFTKKLRNNFLNIKEISSLCFDDLSSLFKKYICIGGMPFIVKLYLETKNIDLVRREQLNILENYKDDFGKHLNENEEYKLDKAFLASILKVFESIPSQLAKENKKFVASLVQKNASLIKLDNSIQWLCDYGLIEKCHNISNISCPLNGFKKDDVFKLYFADTGLFVACLDEGTNRKILNNELDIYKGCIYENIVADALIKSSIPLYYYRKDSGLEIDFVTTKNAKPIIIEVKATNGNAKSAKMILKDPNNDVDICLKVGNYNLSKNNGFINIPHFLMVFVDDFLKNNNA